MLSRHLKTYQVKCNFCLQWMSISIDIKFNINVCDNCLNKGCQQNSLKAISSAGDIYQLYIVKQNSVLDISSKDTTIQNWFEDAQTDKLHEQLQDENSEKSDFLQEIDQHRNTEIKDIMTKWSILSSFLNQKDFLSSQEIKYLKILVSQKAADLKKQNKQFTSLAISSKSFQEQANIFQTDQKLQKITLQKQNNIFEIVSKIDLTQINGKIKNKQNIQILNKNSFKDKQNSLKIQERAAYKSPVKLGLKQRDSNLIQISDRKLSGLKQNNYTPGKRIHTSTLDDNISLGSSCVKSFYGNQTSSRSAFGSSVINSITKRLNTQQLKKFQQTKNKIVKYLQKTYDSESLGRLMFSVVFEAFENTSIIGKSLELVSYNLSYTDFRCYLESFDWTGIQVLKIVKTKLSDDQLKTLIDFIVSNKLQIKVLVLTSNKLTQASIEYLSQQDLSSVKQIYLGKNRIMKGKVRAKISALQNKYSLYM